MPLLGRHIRLIVLVDWQSLNSFCCLIYFEFEIIFHLKYQLVILRIIGVFNLDRII